MTVSDPRDVVDVLRQFHAMMSRRVGDADVVETVATFVLESFGAASATINRVDHSRGAYHSVVNVGRLGLGETTRPADESYGFAEFPWATEMLLAHRGYATDLSDERCPPEYQALLSRLDKRACLGAPIERRGQLLGEVWLTRDIPFEDRDIHLLTAIGAATARYLRAEPVTARR